MARYGFSAKKDLLGQIMDLNGEVTARIKEGKPVIGPGDAHRISRKGQAYVERLYSAAQAAVAASGAFRSLPRGEGVEQ